uniref:Uncharacterized protein n=1 Tax=Bracon brevicornis TaxID=1563983 RepID=A0A6V7LEW5_9HYME
MDDLGKSWKDVVIAWTVKMKLNEDSHFMGDPKGTKRRDRLTLEQIHKSSGGIDQYRSTLTTRLINGASKTVMKVSIGRQVEVKGSNDGRGNGSRPASIWWGF